MKKVFFFACVALLAACNSKEPAKTDTTKTEPVAPTINSPYEIGYSSKFVMDEPKNAETTLSLWKVWDAGDLSKAKEMFADSMEMHFADGSMMMGTSDSIIAMTQPYRKSLGTVESRIDAIMAVKSTDKNEHWVCIWGMEKNTSKGKTDSSYLQETWRFNNAGKANLLYQFRASGAPPKK